MGNLIFALRGQRIVCCGRWRRAVTPWGTRGAAPLISGPLMIRAGTLDLTANAVRIGVEYNDIDASGFAWQSRDGIRSMWNTTPASGGELYDSGDGEGTLIARYMEEDPPICTAYVTDEATG